MTRKKKRPQPPKRLQVTDSEGWTHVLKGLKTLTVTPSSPSYSHQFLPVPTPENLTLADLQRDHLYYQQQWRDDPTFKNLEHIFTTDILTSSPNTITHCVCLGLGSLTASRPSSWWELVCLEQILEILHIPPSQVCIQDPVFNALDKAFFASLNFTVLEDPAAFGQVDRSALLFAPHLETAVYAKALERVHPGLCVGTDLGHLVDRYVVACEKIPLMRNCVRMRLQFKDSKNLLTMIPRSVHPHADLRKWENEIFQRFLVATVSRRMPDFERDHWTYFTSICWGKPVEN